MKQKLLCSIITCAVLMGNVCMGQTVKRQSNSPYKFYVDPAIIPANNFVQSTQPGNASASPQATSGYRIMWLEYGDGGFTTNNNTSRDLATAQQGNWLFLSSKLYDPIRDQFGKSSGGPFTNSQNRTNPSDNDVSILTGTRQILITPNANDIISNDTMSFAVTYKFQPAAGKCYYIVFNYNNNVFLQMANGNDPAATNLPINGSPNYPVKYARMFHAETSVNPNSIPNFTTFLSQHVNGSYTNSVIMKVFCSDTAASPLPERNMFFSLISKDGLVLGNSTDINATLVQTNNSGTNPVVVDQHTISGMGVAPSHDPNYIIQSPVCLQLPKTPRLFNYHLHFQNTGPGEADIAEITLQFTPGFDFNTFNLARARFSDENYNINNSITYITNPALNQIVLTMNLHGGTRNFNNPLAGTNAILNPWVNPQTMGDIYFNMMSTTAVPYFITALASIKFHSLYAPPLQWEAPVVTNTAISSYSTCCDCAIFNCGNTKDSTNRIKKAIPIRKNK